MPSRLRALMEGLAWTAPWWIGFLVFLIVPMGMSLYMSFADYPLLQPPVFVGARNYTQLAHDPVYHQVLWNTVVFAALSIPIGTAVAIALALMLNQKLKGQAFFRTCIFVPSIVPLVAAAVVWQILLQYEGGAVNTALAGIGIDGPNWLGSPSWVMISIVMVSLWGLGAPVMIYLAGLQEIPEVLYEAARLDGANTAQQFRHVTLPGLSPVVLFNVIVAIINTWQIFALPYVLLGGMPGPERAAYFYIPYLFDNAFKYLQMGYASAMAWIQFLIILSLTGVVFLLSRRMVHYRGA